MRKLLIPLFAAIALPNIALSFPAIAHNEANGGKGTENNPYSNFIMKKGDVDDEAERPAISDFSSQDKKRRKFKEESADLTGGENFCLGAKGELVPC